MNDTDKKSGPYKSRHGIVCGVCAGMAEHFGIAPFWLRIGVVILFLATGIWPTLILYFVAAFIMKPKPAQPIRNCAEDDFYDAYVRSPNFTIHQIYEKFKNLDRRLQRMEDTVTKRGYDWDSRFNA
jgi:phage shock protein C